MFAAIFYVVAGTLHFIKPDAYLKIVPPYIPWHVALVRLSGGFEILGGLGLLVPQTRRAAAWGLVALLIAVFPANIYMATNPIDAGAASIAPVLRWGRLPVQLLLALFCLEHGRLDTWNRASRQCGAWPSWPVGSTRPSGSSRRL
jgi:uncharacterized membrane protein